jgi:hypothetical protein
MDFKTYKDELSDEYYKGHEKAIIWLFEKSLSYDSDILSDFILRQLLEDENFSLVEMLQKKRLKFLAGRK